MNNTNYEISPGEFPYEVQIVAENLILPWAIDISDEGVIYFTERGGNIRSIENGVLNPEPIYRFTPPFISAGEGGLLGLALDPNFLENHYLYVMYTYQENNQIYSQVVRMLVDGQTASIDKVIIDKIPASRQHNGGRIKIGPDNKLYIATGDANVAELAQDINSLAGKILRLELDGTIPADNPFPNSPVYSYGHRNPQGLTWGENNIMYESEHGQTAHDEINIIVPGGNYGWPLVEGNETTEGVRTIQPLIHSENNTWAPSGIAYINQGPWAGRLVVGSLRGKQLLVFDLDEAGTSVENIESWLFNEYGRLRDVYIAKDRTIYITTSNREVSGNATRGDDRIIRLLPRM